MWPATQSPPCFPGDRADATEEQLAFERNRLARAPLVIAVVSRAAAHAKIPEWEQVLSAGAAAMSLVIAAHALGFAASWITEWYAYDRARARRARPCRNESIAGFVHIGRAGKAAGRPAAARRSATSSAASAAERKLDVLRAAQDAITACRTTRSRRSLRRARSAGSPR